MFRDIIFFVATVYLPFGYPILSGQQFANVIYQGTVVRLYQIPTDPRTDAQLEQRRFFADLSRMRGTLGLFGRAALRSSIGSRWSGNLTQIMKGDVESFYTNALAEWDDFAPSSKADWQAAAPYQATFSNQGMVFFTLARVMYEAMNLFKSFTFEAAQWGETDSAACLDWWQRDMTGVLGRRVQEPVIEWASIPSNWHIEFDNNCANGGFYKIEASAANYALFYFKATSCTVVLIKDSDLGQCKIWLDGVEKYDLNLYNATRTYNHQYTVTATESGLHALKIGGWQGAGWWSLDQVRID